VVLSVVGAQFQTIPVLFAFAIVTAPVAAVIPFKVAPPPAGAANVPSPRRNVVVLLGGVGTPPPTVALIVATLAVAIGVLKVWTPVNVFAASVRAIVASASGNV